HVRRIGGESHTSRCDNLSKSSGKNSRIESNSTGDSQGFSADYVEATVGLSDREKEAFAEIESQLISDDPKFASQMQMGKKDSARRFSTRNIVLWVVVSI